jgi:hypothetical protein
VPRPISDALTEILEYVPSGFKVVGLLARGQLFIDLTQ